LIHERDCEFNIPQRRDEIVLAHIRNELVGYISCSLSNNLAKDAAIYILPEHRKKGITQMFAEIRESNLALFKGIGFF